jgi:hypothetical protein
MVVKRTFRPVANLMHHPLYENEGDFYFWIHKNFLEYLVSIWIIWHFDHCLHKLWWYGFAIGIDSNSKTPCFLQHLKYKIKWVDCIIYHKVANSSISCLVATTIQLPGRPFSPSDISKNCPTTFYCIFQLVCVRGCFRTFYKTLFFIRVPPLNKENLNEFKVGTLNPYENSIL